MRKEKPHERLSEIHLARIHPCEGQPRTEFDPEELQELADSIKENGVLQPLLVRPDGNGDFELIAGERRWRASQMAGLQLVPCLVREEYDSGKLFVLQMVENLQRSSLKPIEEARAFRQCLDKKLLTAEALAKQIGKKRSWIFERMALLNVLGPVKEALEQGSLAPRVALQIHRSELSPAAQADAVKEIVEKKLTTREAEGYLDQLESRPTGVQLMEEMVERGQAIEIKPTVTVQQSQSVQVAPAAAKPKPVDPLDYRALLESDPPVGSADYHQRQRVEEEVNQEQSRRERLAVQSYIESWLKNTGHYPSAQARLVKACMINTEKIREDVIGELEAKARKQLEEVKQELKVSVVVTGKSDRIAKANKHGVFTKTENHRICVKGADWIELWVDIARGRLGWFSSWGFKVKGTGVGCGGHSAPVKESKKEVFDSREDAFYKAYLKLIDSVDRWGAGRMRQRIRSVTPHLYGWWPPAEPRPSFRPTAKQGRARL